jgi:hypothetical protein
LLDDLMRSTSGALLSRENCRSLLCIGAAAQRAPVTYVVFDLHYERFE